jgi:signal-transduction protein with cAMP-binding, CBS, and nucleotidyltransferase domain
MHFDISKFPLFEGIDGKSLASIEKLMTIRDYIKDDVVIQEKSVGNEIYILLKGVVLIQKALTLDASDEDTNKNKALIHLRSEYYPFFGEFAIIEENAKRTATVIADEDCTMGFLSGMTCWLFWIRIMKAVITSIEISAGFWERDSKKAITM